MKRRGLISVLLLLLAYLGNTYMQDERYEHKIYDNETKLGFTGVNDDIKNLIIRSFQPLVNGPTGFNELQDQVKGVLYRVDWIIKDMGEMNVPEEYEKAHQDLLAAYQSFRPSLTDYEKKVQEAVEQEAFDSPSAQKLSDAYGQILLAMEQWVSIYQKKIKVNRSDANLQNQVIYEEFVKRTVSSDIQSIEGNILPPVVKKDYAVFNHMLDNYRNSFPITATYLKHTKVTEPYEKAHQNLLIAYTNLYAFIINGEVKERNDEDFEQFKTQYEDLKKAFDEWNVVFQQQTKGHNSEQISELPEEEVAKDQYAKTNYHIQQLILRSYRPPVEGPAGIDNLQVVVDNVVPRLNEVVKVMEERKVPEKYEQAHQDLLSAYRNFLPILTEYQKKVHEAIKLEATESPSNEQLNAAFLEIAEAAEQWYQLYKKSNNGYGLINEKSALGNIQDQLMYEEYIQRIAGQQLSEIELSILPYVEQKDMDGVLRMQSNQKYRLSPIIDYLKQTKVPEVYEKAHQNLLSTFTDYYNIMTNVELRNNPNDYLEKVQTQYVEMKKAFEEWKNTYLEELGRYSG
ncbi:MAG: hypothetical protein AB2392_23000 [Neobacillus sp.]